LALFKKFGKSAALKMLVKLVMGYKKTCASFSDDSFFQAMVGLAFLQMFLHLKIGQHNLINVEEK
jgi:hypothetical protein